MNYSNYSLRSVNLVLILTFSFLLSNQAISQCTFGNNQYPSTAVATPTTNGTTTTVNTCNYYGEYSSLTGFTAGNLYTLSATASGTGYVTVFNASNVAVAWGNSPLNFTPASSGTYKVQWNSIGCGTDATCHTTSVTLVGPSTPMVYTSSTVTQTSTASTINCASNVQIVRLEITTTGATSPLTLTNIQTNFTGTAPIAGVSASRVYYTGTSTSFATTTLFGSGTPSTSAYNISGSQALTTGTNYFWLVYDLNTAATVGTTIDAAITQFTLTATNYTPATTAPAGTRTTTTCLGPGGIASGLSHWVKSNVGVTGNPVSSWADNSTLQLLGNMVSLSAGASPSVITSAINYENYIRFDGTDDGMSSTNAVTAVTSGLFSNSENSIFMVKNNRQAGNTGFGAQVDFKWESSSSGPYRVGFEVVTTNQRFDFVDDGSGQNSVSTTNMIGQNRIVSALIQATSSSISVNGLPDAVKNFGTTLSMAGAGSTTKKLFLGCNDNSAFPIFADVDIAEEIIFNHLLTASEQLRVESYLAVKYAITLGNSTSPSNYLASNGTITWSGLAAYQNNIIGLGRDDNSSLYTKQSKQPNDSVRIYMGTLQATNAANTSTFTNDVSLVIQGDNAGKLCATTASVSEMPTGLTNCALYSRLEREWRVTRTNMTQNYNMDVKLNACGAPGSVTVADLRLLVDDDGNFANGGTQCYYNGDGTGIVISYANPTITISNIGTTHIPNNSTKYITIASVNVVTPLPVELLDFNAKLNDNERLVDLTWSTETEHNSDYFEVQKLLDNEWTFLDQVKAMGESDIIQYYHTVDPNPVFGINYYRLKQVDKDGAFVYSDVRVVALNPGKELMVFPNPAQNFVQLIQKNISKENISLIDEAGRMVIFQPEIVSEDTVLINTQNIANGVYLVRIGAEPKMLKLIVQH